MLLDIDAALEARIAQVGEPIQWPGRAYDPQHGVGYVRARIAGQDRRPLGLGANAPIQWTGILYLTVHEPVEGGKRAAHQRAMAIANLFPRADTLSAGQARVQIEATTIQPLVETADWLEVTVAVTYLCWEPPA